MRKAFVVLGIILVIAAIKPATTQYRTQISQNCGQAMPRFRAEQTARWIGEWWPHRGNDKSFALCVGLAEYMNYRPLDIAALLATLGIGCLLLGLRHKHGKA